MDRKGNEMARANRVMPNRVDLGKHAMSTMAHCMVRHNDWKADSASTNPHGLRTVMGFCLPKWQRGLVWTSGQKVSFIESAWKGVPLGTYSYNVAPLGHPLNFVVIDGQQRMDAIERYLNDEFPVFGYFWSEVTDVDRRVWSMTTTFASYITETTDEDYLRGYYDLMNFSGTPHKETERASAA